MSPIFHVNYCQNLKVATLLRDRRDGVQSDLPNPGSACEVFFKNLSLSQALIFH